MSALIIAGHCWSCDLSSLVVTAALASASGCWTGLLAAQQYQNAKHIMCNLGVNIKSMLFNTTHTLPMLVSCLMSDDIFFPTTGVEKSLRIILEYSK